MKGLRTDLPWLHAGKMQPLPDSALGGSPAPKHLVAVRVRPCCVTLFTSQRRCVGTASKGLSSVSQPDYSIS